MVNLGIYAIEGNNCLLIQQKNLFGEGGNGIQTRLSLLVPQDYRYWVTKKIQVGRTLGKT